MKELLQILILTYEKAYLFHFLVYMEKFVQIGFQTEKP